MLSEARPFCLANRFSVLTSEFDVRGMYFAINPGRIFVSFS